MYRGAVVRAVEAVVGFFIQREAPGLAVEVLSEGLAVVRVGLNGLNWNLWVWRLAIEMLDK